jgi:hypothetical protein
MSGEDQLVEAHAHSIRHRREIEGSTECGCFHCRHIFSPGEIVAWTDDDEGQGQTALCPYCGIDSVIGSAAGFPITREFLSAMRRRWFGKPNARNVLIAIAVGIGAVAVVLAWHLGKGIKPRALGGPIRIVEVDEAVLKRGFLGIDYDSASEEQLERVRLERGVVVTRVVDDSPAEIGGIETGDILTTANGVPVGSRAELKKLSANWLPGQAVSLTVIRSATDGQSEQVITAHLMSFAEMQELMSRPP